MSTTPPPARYDFCVIGAGIVGVATAYRILRRHPGASLVLLEKERAAAVHQTGHNSGVVHSGIYYPPGSLKAELCRRGARWTVDFAREAGIPVEVCGKLLVATDPVEHERMLALYERSVTNGVEVERIDAAELARREPRVRGTGALFVPGTAIVDYPALTRALLDRVRAAGGEVVFGAPVAEIAESSDRIRVSGPAGSWTARRLVVCAGLQADRMARIAGLTKDFRIVPFRGEYYRLPPERARLVRTLIYPIPDPALPFLGVHLSPTIHGELTVGPNAVLGLAREKYRKWSLDSRDAREVLGYRGFHRLARAHTRTGARELRNSLFRRGYLAECRRYCPELELADLRPYPAGIRAQAVLPDGTLVHDFLLGRTARSVHVFNAPSPAATSALPIADHIVDQLDTLDSATSPTR